MSFDYDAIRLKKHASGTQWAAYSDLFMVLAFIFLLMYMVASLRAGMSSIATHAQIEDAKQEIQLYESIKDQYLQRQASTQEKKIYQDILDKISLLESEANKNKKRLAKEYNDQEIRESSLNQYQQMIKTMINANTIAKSAAFKKISTEKQQNQQLVNEIQQQRDTLASLDNKIKEREKEKEYLKKTYQEKTNKLERKFNDLKNKNEEDQDNLASLEAMIKVESAEKIELKNKLKEEKNALENTINELKIKHDKGQNMLATLENKLSAETEEKARLKNIHTQEKNELENKLERVEDKSSKNQQKLASLEGKLKLTKAEKAALKNAYSEVTQAMENKLQKLQGKHTENQEKLASLYNKNKNEVEKLNADLGNTKEDLKQTSESLSKVNKDLEKKSKDLDKALKLAKRRKDIARRIKDNFKKNGINAEVDPETGDVILDFGNNYFDTDSHKLKSGMKTTIRKAIPIYAQSLFGSKLLASKISSVEIIGFSSPTYAGKPVDPTKLSIENRTAVNYNLDLSYKRARSIFEYIFDTNKIKFNHQNTMVHLINVTGRSFFAEKIDPKYTDGLTIDEFCGQYNCKKSQRVIIKFGLDEKGAV